MLRNTPWLDSGQRSVVTLARTAWRFLRARMAYVGWVVTGRKAPSPPLAKHKVVREYAERYGTRVFVETGTYLGDMVDAVKGIFREIYTIELDPELYDRAALRFARIRHVSVLHGDSGQILADVMAKIDEACTMWLDAHYSGGITARGEEETPIVSELRAIGLHPWVCSHVILIDDARLFTGEGGYPTLDYLEGWSRSVGLGSFEVKDDIVRICPGRPNPTPPRDG